MRNLTAFLCVAWAASLLYGEMVAFWLPSLWTCSWPHLSPASSEMNKVESLDDYVKVAVITDPQLMDRSSLQLAPKSFLLETAQFYTDLYMRRAFMASIQPLKPDMILYLGDYMDGALILSDEDWQESLNRFKHIFDLNILGRSTNIPIYFIPGNHDVGYAAFSSRLPEVIKRYEIEFGERNFHFRAGKVDFIAVDAQTLDGHAQGKLASTTWNFVKNVSKAISSSPKVLLTHIPLYRPDGTSCGPHRSSPIINQRISRAIGDQEILYQNYITEESSNYLLDLIQPALVLSGHDHDQCTVTHKSKKGPIKEHTLGTISWQMGNLYPSFMLLSASNRVLSNESHLEEAISTHLCFLPAQLYIYIWYLSLFVLTLLALLLWPTNGFDFLLPVGEFMGHVRSLISCNIFRGGTKEKNEDENCEFEMVWDAEGSMHLIKKASQVQTPNSREKGSVERGNAVLRSAAKRPGAQEIEASKPAEVNIYVGSDTASKLPLRTNRSKLKMVIRRLIRTIQAFTVIAAVNLPLYMFLLFKDWNDR